MPPVTSNSRMTKTCDPTPKSAALLDNDLTDAAPAPVLRASIPVPILKVPLLGYRSDRLDIKLTPEEAEALRNLRDGLLADKVFSRPHPAPGEAVRWLLRQIATAAKK